MKTYHGSTPWAAHPPARERTHCPDPLGEVLCLRCPFEDDCILPEGGAGGFVSEKRRAELARCPWVQARAAGWGPGEAIEIMGLEEIGR